jgi:integrase
VLADEGKSASTINQTLVAIGEAHKLAGAPDPTGNRIVAEVWQGIRRTIGTAPIRPATPLLVPQLESILEALPSKLIGVRDRALLLIGFAAALRRSELVAIDMEDLTRTPEGYVLKIRRGKTDQTGKGAVVGIPTGKEGTCPVVAIETWLEESGIVNGAVFRSIDRWENIGERLSPIDVARAVQNAVKRAGASPKGFSGHSLRAGLATAAARQGKSTFAIKRQGRWASSQTLDRYVREAELFDGNAVEGIL